MQIVNTLEYGRMIAMTRKGTGAKRLDEPTLTAADWAEAALHLIAEAGLGALTVEALAARLGVTKGSFYWHFKGRSELLAAALGRWEQRATTEALAGLSAVTDPRQRLHLMLDATSQSPRSRSLYAALAEAAGDPIVKRCAEPVWHRPELSTLKPATANSGLRNRRLKRRLCSCTLHTVGFCRWRTRRRRCYRPTGPPTRHWYSNPWARCRARNAGPDG